MLAPIREMFAGIRFIPSVVVCHHANGSDDSVQHYPDHAYQQKAVGFSRELRPAYDSLMK